jgi:PAS domain S-box-containing protein
MAIPLVRGDRTYGLLNIYADRPGAFEGRERAVLEELGGTVTEAIDAIELRASQTELLDSMDDAAFGFSLESGSMVAVNQAAVDRLGYTETELLSMTLADIESERDEAEFEELYARLDEEGGLVFESVHETKSGEGIPAEVNASRVQYRGEETVLAIARDVSRRKRRERSLRTYRQAIEHAGHSIYITDPEGNIEYANPAFEEQTGFSREEVIGEDPSILQSGSYGDDFYDDLWETISNGDVWHHEEMVDRRKDGTEYYVDQTIAPITDDSGAVERYVAVSRDVTELTEYQQTLEERTKQLELLNRIVRHDIRNDMQIVLGRGQLLEQYVSPEGEASLTTVLEHAEHVVELTRTVRELMDTLLADEELTRQSVALDRVLESEISEVDSGDSAAIVRVGELPATDVCANEMLASVFRNLLKNAIQHNDAEVPEVTVRATESEETVTVHVADNGPGVPDARKRVVFGKGEKGLESSGTGLGLYLVQTLVDQYDGDVWVEDNDPRGSVFNVRLQKRTGTTV